MLLRVPEVLGAGPLRQLQDQLAAAPWIDGRATAGYQGARVKHNQQLAEDAPLARELGDLVLGALERNPAFIAGALPSRVYPPLFNRYEAGMQFGNHVDGAVRAVPGRGARLRTDLSATLFLNEPADYDGGDLVIEDTYGTHAVKLPAGHLVVYPASSVHRVTPITRGARIACFFWIQSMVRDDAQRTLLYQLDTAVQRLEATAADEVARVQLAGCYHNLLRMWSET
jgi:PKHD-type hydroxylase